MTAFKTESCAGQYKICIETENEELIEQIIAMTSRTIDDEQCELTDEDAIYSLILMRETAERQMQVTPDNANICIDTIRSINYAIKAIKDRAVIEEKHWSECRQIAHYDNELNCKDGKDWNRTIGV